ncbi:fructosamine kinase family protein [Mesonia maritima]|uniref:fructosamine kinase family protein n=1 Tax=Mesonia maritima TaxID=1793873 RepID=UPI0035E5E2CE
MTEKENLGNFLSAKPLTGGDINEVFYVKTNQREFVVKLNKAKKFPEMFKKETKGLALLASAEALKIPEVICFGEIDDHSYLLLEYLETGAKSATFWEDFAKGLAKLHKKTQSTFGLEIDNYIGSLPQFNKTSTSSLVKFYIEKRLQPQFNLAEENGFNFKTSSFYKNIQQEIPEEAPALIHGDLWNGNYFVSSEGNPCLIDPAVSFAPREMDIAMMKLFGGFSEKLFECYHEIFPLQPYWKKRIELWQLYYLLVHLNLFGSGYYNSVASIVKKYQ